MSDTPQGPDWWQASDDKWYPPPRPEMPGDPATVAAPSGGMTAPTGPPMGPPMAPPGGFPPGPGGAYSGGPSGGFPPAAPAGSYGVPSGPQAPGSGQNKAPLYVAIGAVAVVLIVIIAVVVSSGGDDDDPTTSPTTQQTPTSAGDPGTTAATTDPGSGGGGGSGSSAVDGLEVTDSGFSNTSYGFVITNSAGEARVNFTVDVAIYDTNDTVISNDTHSVGRINAGESLGIGYDITDEVPGGVGRLEFSFEEGYSDSAPEGSFAVSEVSTQTDEFSTETSFTVSSTYQIDLETTYAYAIYRNSSGQIIGGTYGFVDLVPAGGQARGSITSFEPVEGVAATDVYVDQGYF
jgi:hypothetical protein